MKIKASKPDFTYRELELLRITGQVFVTEGDEEFPQNPYRCRKLLAALRARGFGDIQAVPVAVELPENDWRRIADALEWLKSSNDLPSIVESPYEKIAISIRQQLTARSRRR